MGDLLKNKEVTIKKARFCWGCASKKEPGTIMNYLVYVEDSDLLTSYWCEVCNAYFNSHSEYLDDGILYGELKGERSYEEFKQDYLHPTREVLFEKNIEFWKGFMARIKLHK